MRKLILLAVLVTPACGLLKPVIEVKGAISVVTNEAQDVKLKFVEVSAISESDMQAYLEKIASPIESEKAKLRGIYQAAKAEYDSANRDLANARSVLMTASHIKEDELERLNTSVNDLSFKEASVLSLIPVFNAKKTAMKTAKANLEKFPTAEFLFQNLPTGYARAVSDGDGNFTLNLPKKGKFALSAHSTETVLGKQEDYYWLVWIAIDGQQQSPLVLSNHNLMTGDAPGNVAKVAAMNF